MSDVALRCDSQNLPHSLELHHTKNGPDIWKWWDILGGLEILTRRPETTGRKSLPQVLNLGTCFRLSDVYTRLKNTHP